MRREAGCACCGGPGSLLQGAGCTPCRANQPGHSRSGDAAQAIAATLHKQHLVSESILRLTHFLPSSITMRPRVEEEALDSSHSPAQEGVSPSSGRARH